jgi:hypothetical protein
MISDVMQYLSAEVLMQQTYPILGDRYVESGYLTEIFKSFDCIIVILTSNKSIKVQYKKKGESKYHGGISI